MLSKELRGKVKKIEMPEDMRARILRNCYVKLEEERMKECKKNTVFRKPMVTVATLVLCICVTGISAMAASGKLQGFFKDITNWNGTVVGTSYEQATDEVEIKAVKNTERLAVELTVLTPNKAPYIEFDQMGIHDASIVDMDGNIIAKNISSELMEIQNGKVNLLISLEDAPAGTYKIQISELVGSKKADQPLVLNGNWECEFVH